MPSLLFKFDREVTFSGVGIHTGVETSLTISPGRTGAGLRFIRSDLGNAEVPVMPAHLVATSRATQLSSGSVTIRTPEHILSACWGLHLADVNLTLTGEEVPIMDGSAAVFVAGILRSGYGPTDMPLPLVSIESPIWIHEGDAQVLVLPSETPKWTYCLAYPQAFIGQQIATHDDDPSAYATTLSQARTYGFLDEIEALRARGLALGGSLDNAIVIGERDYVAPLRFPSELAMHKLLDLIGDFSCLGKRLCAHIIGIKSGHALHMRAVLELSKTL